MLAMGGALGGFMVSQLGLIQCFLLDSLGFVLSMVCLLFLPKLLGEQVSDGFEELGRSLKSDEVGSLTHSHLHLSL